MYNEMYTRSRVGWVSLGDQRNRQFQKRLRNRITLESPPDMLDYSQHLLYCSYSEMKSTNRRVATTKGAECACSLHSHTSEIY